MDERYRFTQENTSGYSDDELEEFNDELEARLSAANLTLDDYEGIELAKDLSDEISGRT